MTAFHGVMAYDLLTATEHVSDIKCNDPKKEPHSFAHRKESGMQCSNPIYWLELVTIV